MPELKTKIVPEEEKEFTIESNDFFRPDLKQIGNSVIDIKRYFMSGVGIDIAPSNLQSPFKEVKETLLEALEHTSYFEIDTVSSSRQSPKKGFILISESLATILSLDFTVSLGNSNLKCDAVIASPHQSVMVLTFVDKSSNSKESVRYNNSVTSGLIMTIERFTDECINLAYGVLEISALSNVETFETKITSFLERSDLFVPSESLSMTTERYQKILTAIWAGISETKSVVSGSGQVDSSYLRFLTKEQCIVLVENINHREVTVSCHPGCGATTLMLEVARRLSRLGKTLLVCESREDRDRLRNVQPGYTVVGPQDMKTTDLSPFDHILDGTGNFPNIACKKKIWQFTKTQLNEKRQNAEHMEITRILNATSTMINTDGASTEMSVDNLKLVYDCPVFVVKDAYPLSGYVLCPDMKLNSKLVNRDLHVSADRHQLVNTGRNDETTVHWLQRFSGTVSILPKFASPPYSSSLPAIYWEANTRISGANPVTSWVWPLLEIGICKRMGLDQMEWVSEQHSFAWAVRMLNCEEHNSDACAQVYGEGVMVGKCYEKNISSLPGKVTHFSFGVVLDLRKNSLFFLDLDKEIVLQTLCINTAQRLTPTFAIRPQQHCGYDIQMNLVSGGEIAMTTNKRKLISKALFGL